METTQLKSLQQEVLKLEEELVELLFKQSDLLLKQKPYLEHEYAKHIGSLEFDLYWVTVRGQRMKKMRELIQASINTGGFYDLASINTELDTEFKSFQNHIEQKANAIRYGLLNSWIVDNRSPETLDRIKRIYHDLVKKLHPDLNPNQSADDYAAFLAVGRAYRSNDLEALLAWHSLYKNKRSNLLNVDELLDRRAALTANIQKMKEWFIATANEFPFNMETLLCNEESLLQKQEELNRDICQAVTKCHKYIEDILEVLSDEDLHALDTSFFDDEKYNNIILKRFGERRID